MVFKYLADIPFSFLYNAAKSIAMKHKIIIIFMDKNGELVLSMKGILNEDEIKDILKTLSPQGTCDELVYDLQYSYSEDKEYTFVYSEDGIDYSKL